MTSRWIIQIPELHLTDRPGEGCQGSRQDPDPSVNRSLICCASGLHCLSELQENLEQVSEKRVCVSLIYRKKHKYLVAFSTVATTVSFSIFVVAGCRAPPCHHWHSSLRFLQCVFTAGPRSDGKA